MKVTLVDDSSTCAISGAFTVTISDAALVDAYPAPSDVKVTGTTSAETTAPAETSAHTIIANQVSSTTLNRLEV